MNNRDEILAKVNQLVQAHKQGLLGGEKMPEDENPHLDKSSKQNYMYFTLPMALNYQRNSYVLWECANRMYADEKAKVVFDSKEVCSISEELLRNYLVEYKVALQPNKQPIIWKKLCETIENKLDGDIRNLFSTNGYSVKRIKEYIQNNKKDFPYLSGNKICNYWLYVLEQYTDIDFVDRENITVAPDTHVIQASQKLGVISEEEAKGSNVQILLAERWKKLLEGTDLKPIDVHTPMWLWSRGKFEFREVFRMSKFSEKGYFVKENAAIYVTMDMDKTAKWFEDVLGWYSNIVERDSNGKGCYGVVFDMLPEVELVHLAPFTGFQMFCGTPEPHVISFMQVKGIEKMYEYITSNGWDKITEIITQPWGGKTCSLTTIDGYIINIFE